MNMAVTGLKTLLPRMVSIQMKKPRLGRMIQTGISGLRAGQMTLQIATAGTSAELVTRTNCAGFWLRLVAATIDAFLAPILAILAVLILLIPLGVAGLVTQTVHGHLPETVYRWYALGVALFALLSKLIYFAGFESSPLQATPGKLTLGLIVTDTDGRRLTFWRALARNFLKLVSLFTLYIGYILAGLTDRKQALHDMMSCCLVVRKLP